MQSGLYHGYIGLVRNIISQLSSELKVKPRVIATGGLAGLITAEIPEVEFNDPNLVLEGLRIIFQKNKAEK
jgi:type III pantothenate kinase